MTTNYASRNKLNRQQRQAASTIFGQALGKTIISHAEQISAEVKKGIGFDDFVDKVAALKAATNALESRSISYAARRGNIGNSFYPQNGRVKK